MVSELRKIVLDVLKPHEPDIVSLAQELAGLKGIEGVNISVYELDKRVENVKVTVEGRFTSIRDIQAVISGIGGSIHSIDEVIAGKKVVIEEDTLQDRVQERERG